MKKFLLLFIACIAFISCEGPMGPQGPIGPQGPQGEAGESGESGGGAYWKYYTYTVRSQDWELVSTNDGLNTYYMYEFRNTDITQEIYDEGFIVGYLVQSPGEENEVITPLPYVVHRGETLENGDSALWTETYTYDYMPGSVAFYVQFSDFFEQQPEDMTFRLVLHY